jgi:uncharacterized damage-inducible protein DinB
MSSLILHELAAYTQWANRRFLDRLTREPDAVLDAHAPSSFPSLRETLLHIRNAECAWTCRLVGEPVRWPAEASVDIGTLAAHTHRLHALVTGMDDAALQEARTYLDRQGNGYHSVVWRMLLHCFNHSTQHRGQLITQMRQLGLDEVPANDLVVFQRSRQG